MSLDAEIRHELVFALRMAPADIKPDGTVTPADAFLHGRGFPCCPAVAERGSYPCFASAATFSARWAGSGSYRR